MRAKIMSVLGVGVATVALVHAGLAGATPASGFTGTTVALGHFGAFDVDNHSFLPAESSSNTHPGNNLWMSSQKTKGPSDVYVQNNVLAPGGTSGWHTHPGHSLIIVTTGTVTVYDGDDPSCTPREYSAGQGFVDAGGDHVHLLRNEGSVEAKTVALQVIPAGATRRIDAPAPAHCPF